jgi:1,4-alpha-glucan branching enzyme
VYDYTPERSIAGLMKRLDYIENLGVNAIELMPVTEFDGNYNWGYSPNHYFALDKAYGTPEQLKEFVDECHKRGIAVILDMVFNHATGLNPMNKLYPYGTELAYNPWFNVNAPHSDNVYEDWNHDFYLTKLMFTRALQYWLKEYKIDGYRMDLSHGLCGTTNNAMTHIADYYNNGV